MSDPVVIKLSNPIAFGTRTVDTLTLRPLKAKDLRRVREVDSNIVNALNFASYLSGEVKEVIDELEGEDLREVLDAVNRFFLNIQGTGAKSSGS